MLSEGSDPTNPPNQTFELNFKKIDMICRPKSWFLDMLRFSRFLKLSVSKSLSRPEPGHIDGSGSRNHVSACPTPCKKCRLRLRHRISGFERMVHNWSLHWTISKHLPAAGCHFFGWRATSTQPGGRGICRGAVWPPPPGRCARWYYLPPGKRCARWCYRPSLWRAALLRHDHRKHL